MCVGCRRIVDDGYDEAITHTDMHTHTHTLRRVSTVPLQQLREHLSLNNEFVGIIY